MTTLGSERPQHGRAPTSRESTALGGVRGTEGIAMLGDAEQPDVSVRQPMRTRHVDSFPPPGREAAI